MGGRPGPEYKWYIGENNIDNLTEAEDIDIRHERLLALQ
jgi:hypothetical protein